MAHVRRRLRGARRRRQPGVHHVERDLLAGALSSRTPTGRRGRIVVGYKDFKPDPVDDPALRTIHWRDLGRPEQELVRRAAPDQRLHRLGRPAVRPDPHATPGRSRAPACRSGVPMPGELVGLRDRLVRSALPGARRRVAGAARALRRSSTSRATTTTPTTRRSTARTRGRSCSRRARWTGRGRSRRVAAATAPTTTSGRRCSG